MATNRPNLKHLVSRQLPEFIREDYPTFVAFLEAYYEFVCNNECDLYSARDIDTTLDNFLTYFKNELALHYDINGEFIKPRHDLARIKDQHLAKGSEASFKFLFRLLFNKNVTVQYPGQQILRASDGKWQQDVSVFARVNAGSPDDVVGRLVDVITPNRVIRVLVDRRQDVEIEIDRVVRISDDTFEFYIDRRFFGDVSVGDRIRYAGIFDATILATTAKIDIQQRGKGFKLGQLYPIKNGNGAGSVLKIKSVDANGGITSAEFVRYGIGYDTNFTATLIAGQTGQTVTGAGTAALNVQTISSGVTSVIINNGGSGYTNPSVFLSGGGYTHAATVGNVVVENGVITRVDISDPGSGYTATPSVIFTDETGTGASASTSVGNVSAYSINETTEGFSEQGQINKADYAIDTPVNWLPSTNYAQGAEIYFADNVYTVTVAGRTSSIPPSHTSGSAANGTATLVYSRKYGSAFDGTYAGDTLREFFYDSSEAIVDADSPAIIAVHLGPLTKYPGYYRNNDGFLSDAIFVQDSSYYQAFSYVLKIDEKLETYKSVVKSLVHPAGLALFGEYDVRNEFDISVTLESMIKILVVNAQDEVYPTEQITYRLFGKQNEDTAGPVLEYAKWLMEKPLQDATEVPLAEIAHKDVSKALAELQYVLESNTFSMVKPLADSFHNDDSKILDFSKAAEDSFSVVEANTFTMIKPINHSTVSTDELTSRDFSKALEETVNPQVDDISEKVFGKALIDSNAPVDSISAKDFGKSLEESVDPSDLPTISTAKYTSDEFSTADGGYIGVNSYEIGHYFEELYVGNRLTF